MSDIKSYESVMLPIWVVSSPGRSADGIMSYLRKGASAAPALPFAAPIHLVSLAEARRECTAAEARGVVIINSPLCDGDGIKLADELTAIGHMTLVILPQERYPAARAAAAEGVFILPRPISESVMFSVLWLLATACVRVNGGGGGKREIAQRMDEIKIVDRAKWLLIDYLKMSEAQAHRYIEKQAMDQRITRLEAAKNILKTYLG